MLDCKKRLVTLGDEKGRKVVIHRGHESPVMASYMYLLDLSKYVLAVVPIVREYPDVFEEVTGLPPHREIEFYIDLVKDAKPVVLTLRQMTPKEQRELEGQLKELLKKGFIQRSYSS